mmetsp:Transcript_10030/g.27319  ORF Transcript_10030/g.27319 Transcript_10030/m.27319 type:complete len:211 (-) Transcript_10030:1316-1948(-)
MFQKPGHHCVAAFVQSHGAALLRADHLVLFLQPADHPVDGFLEMVQVHRLVIKTGSNQRGFVAHVRDVCASHAWRQGSQALCVVVDGLGQLQTFQVHPEDLLPALDVRRVHIDLPAEPARSEERLVQDVCTVGAANDHDIVRGCKAIHLHEQLVQGALPVSIRPNGPSAPGSPNGINLVNEYHAGGQGARLVEEVPYFRGTNSSKHLAEL